MATNISDSVRKNLSANKDAAEKIFLAVEKRGSGEFTDEEREQLSQIEERQKTLNADLDRAIRIEERLDVKFNELLGRPQSANSRTITLSGKESAQAKMASAKVENGIGHFIRASLLGPDHRDIPAVIKNAMSTGSNPAGGFLVPSELFGEVIDLMRARSVLAAAGMRTIVQTTGDLSIAGVDGDPTYAVYGENATITESSIEFKLTRLDPLKIATLIACSRELVEDASNFVELVSSVLQQSMAQQIDRFGIRGGSGFNGLENHADISETASIGAIQWSDINTACTEIRKENGEPGAVIMDPAIHDALYQTTSSGLWIGPSPNNADVMMLHSTNVTSTKVIAGDFSNLIMGVRTAPRVEISSEAGDAFSKHQVLFKIVARVDFAVVRPAMFYRLADVTAS